MSREPPQHNGQPRGQAAFAQPSAYQPQDGQPEIAGHLRSAAEHNDLTCSDTTCNEPHSDVTVTPLWDTNPSYKAKSNLFSYTAGKKTILTDPNARVQRCHIYKRRSLTAECPAGENCDKLHMNGSAVGDKIPAHKDNVKQGAAEVGHANANVGQGIAGSSAKVGNGLTKIPIFVGDSKVYASSFVVNAGLHRAIKLPTPRGVVCNAKHDSSKTASCTFLHYRSAQDERADQQQSHGNEEVAEEAPNVAAPHEQAQEDEWDDAAEDTAALMAEMQMKDEFDFEELANEYELSVEDLAEGYRVYGNVGGAIEYATNRRDE